MNPSSCRAAILVEDLYQDQEVWYPLFRLREAGAKVSVLGTGSKTTYASKHGYPIQVDGKVDDAKAGDFQCVIIPGGYAPDILRRYEGVLRFVRDADQREAAIGSICHGPWVLCSANVLKGRRATCFHAIKDDVVNAGATYSDEEVVVDRNLVTSRKPEDLPAFMREILKLLETRKS
ncbi:MAG: type 1 glutamine amidotransferase [Nitrospirae bacterium]|nr:type 1 glutamine amidotransferase [Nitrospirota bacterium]